MEAVKKSAAVATSEEKQFLARSRIELRKQQQRLKDDLETLEVRKREADTIISQASLLAKTQHGANEARIKVSTSSGSRWCRTWRVDCVNTVMRICYNARAGKKLSSSCRLPENMQLSDDKKLHQHSTRTYSCALQPLEFRVSLL